MRDMPMMPLLVEREKEEFFVCSCGAHANSRIFKFHEGCYKCGKPYIGIQRIIFDTERDYISFEGVTN